MTLPLPQSLWIFFSQAEDGIRDKLVTGVQTCALPISDAKTSRAPRELAARAGHDPFALVEEFERVGFYVHRIIKADRGRAPTREEFVSALEEQIGRASCRERVQSSSGDDAIRSRRSYM